MKDSISKLAVATLILLLLAGCKQTTETIYYVHADHLNAPTAVTDQNKAVVWEGHRKPFGETEVTVALIEQNIRFPGQYFDEETGLHYNYFRDYDPTTGRYLQSDPIGLGGGINTYAYVESNPITRIDPTGEFWFLLPLFAGGGGVAVGGTAAAGGISWGTAILGGIGLGVLMTTPGDTDQSQNDASETGALNGCPPKPGNQDPCKGLRKQLQEHKDKLRQYQLDPMSMDNKGHLANALSSGNGALYNTIYNNRLQALQNQIANFERQLKECGAKYGK